VEEQVEDPGSTRRQEVRTSGARLPLLNGCGKDCASAGERTLGVRCQSGSSECAGIGNRNGGWRRLVPRTAWASGRNSRYSSPPPPFMASAGKD